MLRTTMSSIWWTSLDTGCSVLSWIMSRYAMIEVSGVRSSWFTVARKSVFALSSSRSCLTTCCWLLIRWLWMSP